MSGLVVCILLLIGDKLLYLLDKQCLVECRMLSRQIKVLVIYEHILKRLINNFNRCWVQPITFIPVLTSENASLHGITVCFFSYIHDAIL